MDQDKKPNNEQAIIDDLNKPGEPVDQDSKIKITPGLGQDQAQGGPGPGQDQAQVDQDQPGPGQDQAQGGPGPGPGPSLDTVEKMTGAIINTLDTITTKVCCVLAKSDDINKYRFNDIEKASLNDAWQPVVIKYWGKIPVEIICIATTGIILGQKFILAKQDAPQDQDKKKK